MTAAHDRRCRAMSDPPLRCVGNGTSSSRITRLTAESSRRVRRKTTKMRAARPSLLPGRVAWCAALPDGTCCAVVHFDKPLRFADVQDIAGLPPPRFAGRGAADVRYALVIGPAVSRCAGVRPHLPPRQHRRAFEAPPGWPRRPAAATDDSTCPTRATPGDTRFHRRRFARCRAERWRACW